MSDLQKTLEFLVKKHSKKIASFGLLKDVVTPQEVISTGSLMLDFYLRYGGYPRARIAHIFGPERSMKSTQGLISIREALRAHPDKFAVLADFERTMDKDTSIKQLKYLGWTDDEIDRLMYIRDMPEACFDALEDLVQQEACVAAMVDSLGAFTSERAYEKSFSDNQKLALNPTLITDFLKRINQKNNNAAIYLINQARASLDGGPYGPEYEFSGGWALHHFPSVTLDSSGWHIKDVKDRAYAHSRISLRLRIEKCKIGGEGRTVTTEFDLKNGCFDLAYECIKLGYELKIFEQRGAWYYMHDGINGGSGGTPLLSKQGSDNFEEEIKKNPELLERVISIVRSEIKGVKTLDFKQLEEEYDATHPPEQLEGFSSEEGTAA